MGPCACHSELSPSCTTVNLLNSHLQLMGPSQSVTRHSAELGMREVDVVPLVVDEALAKGPLAGSGDTVGAV
jgi:hypothetical protein